MTDKTKNFVNTFLPLHTVLNTCLKTNRNSIMQKFKFIISSISEDSSEYNTPIIFYLLCCEGLIKKDSLMEVKAMNKNLTIFKPNDNNKKPIN